MTDVGGGGGWHPYTNGDWTKFLIHDLHLFLHGPFTRVPQFSPKGGFLIFFLFMYIIQKLIHLPPLRLYCVGGCWDGMEPIGCCDFGFDSQTL
jgi:hypothetical protein